MSIPVVDLEDLKSHDPECLERAARQILEGYGEYGLVYIANHGIDRRSVTELYGQYIDVTGRPEAEKRTWGGADIWYQRGWTPPNTEKAVVAGGQPDFKECYFAAPIRENPAARRDFPEVYASNVWPEGAPEFRKNYLGVGRRIHDVGLQMLRGCAIALGLPEYSLQGVVYGGAHVSRLLRYLPLTQQQAGTDILWGEEHTDFNLLTLLPGGQFYDPDGHECGRPDDDAGLYLRTRATAEHPNGRMVRGTPPEGCMVSQVGQQLEILSGGRFQATPHIVRAPRQPGFTRCSIAHFIHVEAHQTLYPMVAVTGEIAQAYRPPVLAGNYATKTLIDIGLAPPSMLDRLGYRHYDRLARMRKEEG